MVRHVQVMYDSQLDPAHLGMHWVVDAALAARANLEGSGGKFDVGQIRRVTLQMPHSKYIDCPFPDTDHQARHSFQFNACSALLDNNVIVGSFSGPQINRPALKDLLSKVRVESPEDNHPSFDNMYCTVVVETEQGPSYAGRCDTFYGHWRKPLSSEDLVRKLKTNASTVLTSEGVERLVDAIRNMENIEDASGLCSYLRMTANPQH